MLRLTLAFCISMLLPVVSAYAQAEPAADALKRLEDRVTQLELELARQHARNPGDVPTDAKAQKVYMLLETPHIGHVYTGGPNGSRFFVGKLLIVNLTSQAMVIKRDDLTLQIDGLPQHPKDVPEPLKYHGFQIGRQHIQLEAVTSFKEFRIPAGGTGSGWVFVPDLPVGGRVPRLVLELTIGDRKEKVDINAQQRSLLGLEVTYMGPRNCLALFTISGELNMINLGSLAEELDRLSVKKIGRVVLTWTESASPLQPELQSWLEQWANSMGRNEYNTENFPAIPSHLREIHLARMPRHDQQHSEETAEEGVIKRVHKTEPDAVRAALQSACETLPRDELLGAIEKGHPWSRAAVLAYGAGRLSADKLPLILKYADDSDPAIQSAALTGLRHFGETQAIAKLLEYVRKNVEPLSAVAISSLASSRFPAANEALLQVVKTEPPASKKTIVRVLAEFPRPIWSELLYEFAKNPDSGLNLEALRGLQRVGHPQLVALLIASLKSPDESLKQLAFDILISRTDRESEQVAINYTLEHLKTAIPTPQMLTLLTRVKDQRAVPLLLTLLTRAEDKDAVLDVVLQIGDQSLADKLLPLYETMQITARAKILATIRKWDVVKFRELARTALLSSEGALISAAIQGLVDDGSPGAIKMLSDALDKNPETESWMFLCNALGQLGTESARKALLKARDSEDIRKRDVAIQGLRNMYQRSPAVQEFNQGKEKLREMKYEDGMSLFSQAIGKDPTLPLAYLGRGDCEKGLGKLDDARKDYEQAYELDPFSGDTITSVCIVRIMQGQVKEGLERLEAEMKKGRYFRQDEGNFYYNSACAYGRAVEYLEQHADFPDRDQLKVKYASTAVHHLKSAIKKDFSDWDLMAIDPDLKSLKMNAEYKRILEKREAIVEEVQDTPRKPG
ncbi:MAG: repeat-containing protein [Planctomycetaceae bacterium]|nr:repeat-containing protein [Planctomycetaceae bacterium]